MKNIKNKGEHQIMGLFDNLFKKSKPSSTDRNSQVQDKPKISFEPFKSEAEKQYYEMAYGLLASSTKERSSDDIRRFVGFHTSRETDFSISSSARKFLSEGIMSKVSLFKSNADLTAALTAKGISADKIEQIIELNKKLDESFAYRYLPKDADTICNPNNYDCDFYKKTLVFKNSRDSIVPLTAERAAALKAAEEKKIADQKAAAERAAAEKAAAEKAAAEKAAAEKAAAERAAAAKSAAEKAAAAPKENPANATTNNQPKNQPADNNKVNLHNSNSNPKEQSVNANNSKSQNSSEQPKISFEPFENEFEKRIYEMIYGLLASSDKDRYEHEVQQFIRFHSATPNLSSIKKYFNEFLGHWSLYKNSTELTQNLKRKYIPADKIKQIIEANRNLDKSLAYRYLPDDAEAICKGKVSKGSVVSLAELLSNETVKQYYTIICALLESMKADIVDFDSAKKYIEFQTKQECDDQKLKYALKFTNEKDARNKFGISVDDINKYKCSKKEVLDICYSEIIKSIKADCVKIFDVVATYGAEHFEEGLSKKSERYEKKIGAELTCDFFQQAIREIYFENPVVAKTPLFNRINQYSYDARMREYYRLGIGSVAGAIPTITKQAAAITLRALHFEKYGQSCEEYRAITEDDCREFISNCEHIQREIEDEIAKDPFNTNAKKLINVKAKEIFHVFENIKITDSWYLPSDSDNYYADSLCNGFWKWIAEDYETVGSTDPNMVFEILLTHFKPNERDFEILDEQRQNAEQQRREVEQHNERVRAINKQCRSCALCGGFSRTGPCTEFRENCPSWTPRT